MKSALSRLAAFAVSLISFAIAYKYANIQGWEIYAFIGGAILFFVIAIIVGKTFDLGLILAFSVSAIITAFIMAFVSITFCFIMILVFLGLIAIIVAILGMEEESIW